MRFSILWRLALSFTVLIAFSLFFGYKGIVVMNSLQNETKTIYEKPFVFAKVSRDVHIQIKSLTLLLRNALYIDDTEEAIVTENSVLKILENMKVNHRALEASLIGEKVSFMAYLSTFDDFEKSARTILALLNRHEQAQAKTLYVKKYIKYEKRLLLNIIALQEHADANAKRLEQMGEKHLRASIEEFQILLGIVFVLGFIFSLFAYMHYIRPIRKFRDLIEKFARGDTSETVYGIDKKDEMGDIARSIENLKKHLEVITEHTDKIAHGDYSALLVEHSKEDKLVHSIQVMTQNLKENFEANQKHIWIEQGRNRVSDVLRANQSKEALGDKLLHVLSEFTSAQIGTIYLYNGAMLVQTNRYAYTDGDKKERERYAMGEGLIGQAALKDGMTRITNIPQNYIQVQSALGNARPDTLIFLPFYFKGSIKGVIELGYFGAVEDKVAQLLEGLCENIGIAYDNIDAKMEIKRALEQEQAISEELQVQEEELRVSNERLVEQSAILKKQKEHLEKTSTQLAQKAVDLEQASKYKSEFLANMSHELRTPLNSLLILSHTLAANESKGMSEDEVESARAIHESGEHLLSLINDILDISKVEAGKMLVNQDNVETQELLTSMDKRFAHVAEQKNIFYKSEMSADFPELFLSDRVKLGQIVSNFISNAIKFTDKGGVHFKLKKVAENLYFEVHDSGIGVPKEKQALIFESFQQADGSTSRNFGGTGLGLSIALSFTKLLGGKIDLQSKEGEGSVFTCIIPFKIASAKEIQIEKLQEKAPPFEDDRERLDQTKSLFLIIEDDEKFSKLLYKHIKSRGDQAIVAGDGESGILLANKYKVSGIILDYMLPGLDGHDVLKVLKEHEETKDIPVHVLSALNDLADMKELGAIGQDAKPISKEKIDALLDGFTSSHLAEKLSIFTAQVKEENLENITEDTKVFDGKKVLIVDDDMRNTYSLAKVFRAKGLEVLIAPSGAKALNLLSENEDIDIILMDIMMPEMDGYEVTRLIRATEAYKEIPIVAVTASAMSGDKEKCLESGANDYMSKPVDIEKLFVMMQMWLS